MPQKGTLLKFAGMIAFTVTCTVVIAFVCSSAVAAAKRRAPTQPTATVYYRQPPTTEKELLSFLELLPKFRSWARSTTRMVAYPRINNGRADFFYSEEAAAWIAGNGWKPVRFFCVMGRMAAALAIIEEGNDLRNARPADMPAVSADELELARLHLGELLKAGGEMPPPERFRP